jgi:hypothetical protein
MQLEPLASVKIRDAGKNFLTYEHLSGKVQYDFTKNNNGAFEYKIQGKTSYATIR